MFAGGMSAGRNLRIASGSRARSLERLSYAGIHIGLVDRPPAQRSSVRVHDTLLGNPLLLRQQGPPTPRMRLLFLVFGSSTSPRHASAGSL